MWIEARGKLNEWWKFNNWAALPTLLIELLEYFPSWIYKKKKTHSINKPEG